MEICNNNIIWKSVIGFEDKYLVSNTGIIKSLDSEMPNPLTKKGISIKKGIILKQWIENGYYRVGVRRNGDKKLFFKFVHRLVAESFIEFENEKPYVNHIDGNKLNNNVENLEWCTPKENVHHSINTLNKRGVNKKRVLDTFTGIYYESALEAFNNANCFKTKSIFYFRKIIRKNSERLIYA